MTNLDPLMRNNLPARRPGPLHVGAAAAMPDFTRHYQWCKARYKLDKGKKDTWVNSEAIRANDHYMYKSSNTRGGTSPQCDGSERKRHRGDDSVNGQRRRSERRIPPPVVGGASPRRGPLTVDIEEPPIVFAPRPVDRSTTRSGSDPAWLAG